MNKFAALSLFVIMLSGCGVNSHLTGTALSAQSLAAQSASSPAKKIFNTFDTNKDGKLTWTELFNTPSGQPAGGWQPGQKEAQALVTLDRADTNGDGVITLAEFLATQTGSAVTPTADPEVQAAQQFALFDMNQDSRVTIEELLDTPSGQPVGGWQPGQREAQAVAMVRQMDTNQDGAISFHEFLVNSVGHPVSQ